MRKLTSVALIVVAWNLLCQAGFAQAKSVPFPVDEALAQKSFPPFAPISLSPDGQWVAYTLKDLRRRETKEGTKYQYFSPTGVGNPAVGGQVWLTNTKTGENISLAPKNGTSSWAPVWSPDGKYLAFFSDEGGSAHLWVWEKASGKAQMVSDAIVRSFTSIEVCRWTPDGKKIVFKILPYGTTLENGENIIASFHNETKSSEKASKTTVTIFDSSLKEGKAASLDEVIAYQADLAVVDLDKGIVKTLARGFRIFNYWVSPDGQNVAFTHLIGLEAPNSGQSIFDLLGVTLNSPGDPRIIASKITQSYGVNVNVSWSPDSKLLSYVTAKRRGGESFLVEYSSGAPRRATKLSSPNFGDYFRPPLWDPSGQFLYLLTLEGALWKISVADGAASEIARIPNRSILDVVWSSTDNTFWSPDGGARSLVLTIRDDETKQVGFYKVELNTGKVVKLLEENKYYGTTLSYFRDTSADGQRIAYIAEDAAHSAVIWMLDGNFSNPRQITKTNPQLAQYKFGSSRLVEWRSVDGVRLQGTLLLPAGYKEGERYPMIVYPYPIDARSNNVNRFGITGTGVENIQLFATRGYAVFFPDIVLNQGTTMRDLAKSIIPGVDKVVEMGIADNDRIGVIGHSWGGYTALSLIVQTPRFKAAVMRGGYGNLIGMYGDMESNGSARAQMLYEADFGNLGMGGTPWQFRDRYIENSPVFYLDKVETPLLIIHGGAERTVQVHNANEIFVDLRRLGKTVIYAHYDGEQHTEGLWGYANQVDYVNRVIAWFDKWLKAPDAKTKTAEGR